MHDLVDEPYESSLNNDKKKNQGMTIMLSILQGKSISSLVLALMFFCRLTMISGPKSETEDSTSIVSDRQSRADERAYWQKNPTILVSIDGFRPDYLERGITPHLSKLALSGVKAPAMRPQFPVLTFPNHFTMMTGVYPDTHGMVNNQFYDPELDLSFSYNQSMVNESLFWNYEPLWNTVLDYGHKSAVVFYPGINSDTIMGRKPTYRVPFNFEWNETDIMHQVIQYMDLPAKERPSFIVGYFDIVDKSGHRYGPESAETDAAIMRADDAIGLLVNALKEKDCYEKTNIIVLSDHGMQRTEESKYLYIDEMPLSVDRIRFFYSGPIGFLYPRSVNDTLLLYKELQSNTEIAPYCTVYLKENLPVDYYYGKNPRVAPIVIVAEPEYVVMMRKTDDEFDLVGVHGYPLPNEDMKAIFIYDGPSLHSHASNGQGNVEPDKPALDEISNLDIYPFMAKLLATQGLPGNGTDYLSDTLLQWPSRNLVSPLSRKAH